MKICLLVALATASVSSSAAFAASDTELLGVKLMLEEEQQAIDLASAIIHSPQDLQQHLAANHASALNKLSPTALSAFIEGLVFTPRGLGSYNYLPLQTLSITDIHRILALFGVQTSMEAIPGLMPRNASEELMLRPMARPGRPNSQCYMGDKNTYCRATPSSVCPTSCEPF
ncbi:MAG: hypothetical protein K0S73_1467 [Stenotrophomonas rhizophila]|jgi:hypothetical protein|nr:hypothetical protein [Stenotrophomonas rhizophila]